MEPPPNSDAEGTLSCKSEPATEINEWAASVVQFCRLAGSTTVGLISGSTQPNDRRCVNAMLSALSDQLASHDVDRRLLAVRLDVFPSREVGRQLDQSASQPAAMRSPLGRWQEVSIPVPVGRTVGWSLLQLPAWIDAWQKRFGLIAIDSGPVHLLPSRTIGGLCRNNYVLLGPEACPSAGWLKRQLESHANSGSPIAGALLVQAFH